jgi:CheY-like chemotaxis protein
MHSRVARREQATVMGKPGSPSEPCRSQIVAVSGSGSCGPELTESTTLDLPELGGDALATVYAPLSAPSRRPVPDITRAAAAAEMVAKASQPFDVLCVDREMPGVDGPQLACTLRQRGFGGAVIGVTGALQPEEVESFLGAGADAVTGKPVNLAELHSVIRQHVAARRRLVHGPEASGSGKDE